MQQHHHPVVIAINRQYISPSTSPCICCERDRELEYLFDNPPPLHPRRHSCKHSTFPQPGVRPRTRSADSRCRPALPPSSAITQQLSLLRRQADAVAYAGPRMPAPAPCRGAAAISCGWVDGGACWSTSAAVNQPVICQPVMHRSAAFPLPNPPSALARLRTRVDVCDGRAGASSSR